MRKFGLVLVAALTLFTATMVGAIRGGQPDNGEHPYVGLVVFFDSAGVPQWRCTGTLISPTVLLTAGHCAELNAGAVVWFDEDVGAVEGYPYGGGTSYTGTAYSYPGWGGGFPNTGDVGLVVLDEPVTHTSTFATLAPADYLDALETQRGRQNTSFEVVGYGLQSVRPQYSARGVRLQADVQLVNLRSALTDGFNIQTTNAPGRGTGGGGTCFGDSGGAIFHEGYIVAVNSFVLNENCAGASFGYRIDNPDVLAWIASFL